VKFGDGAEIQTLAIISRPPEACAPCSATST
jgi:hypothetical protein